MLKIGFNMDMEINTCQFPIYFDKRNICVHCGAEKQLTFVDKYGKETNQEIHAFDYIRCKSCGSIYSIYWNKDESNGKMYPIAVDPSFRQEFINLFNLREIKNNGQKQI